MSKTVLIAVESESGSEIVQLDIASATRLQTILRESMDGGEYPEEANEILNNGTKVDVFGIVSTCGDGFGWFDPE